MTTSISFVQRSASALRVKVLDVRRPSGSRYLARYPPLRFSMNPIWNLLWERLGSAGEQNQGFLGVTGGWLRCLAVTTKSAPDLRFIQVRGA